MKNTKNDKQTQKKFEALHAIFVEAEKNWNGGK